jgi:hypothetical protein
MSLLIMPPIPSPDFSSIKSELEDDENLANEDPSSHFNDSLDIELGIAELVPILRAQAPRLITRYEHKRATLPIPARSGDRARASAVPSSREGEIVMPVPRHVSSRAEWLRKDVDVQVGEEDEKQKAEREVLEKMRWMHGEWIARRLVASPVSEEDEVEYDEECEKVWRYRKAAKVFDLSEDGERFRNPFLEGRGGSEEDKAIEGLEDVLGLVASPGESKPESAPSKASIEKAVDDESVLGESSRISPKYTQGPAEDDFDNPNFTSYFGSDTEVSEQDDEMESPVDEQWPILFREWAIRLVNTTRGSTASDYSSLSRLGSTALYGEAKLYSLIGNPWHTGDRTVCVRDVEEFCIEQQFVDAAIEFFAGFEVEALVADSKTPGYEFEDNFQGKGASRYNYDPHEPDEHCGCYWCDKYYYPRVDDFGKHDPNKWCHCMHCKLFRDEEKRKQRRTEEKQERIEEQEMWKARFSRLSAEARDAEVEEESRLLDLMDFQVDQDDEDVFNHKKRTGLGDWLRSKLRSIRD